jgi:hypothetical protein
VALSVYNQNTAIMPMNKFFTLNYLINSYKSGQAECKLYQYPAADFDESILDRNIVEVEPLQSSIDAILDYASQYEVVESEQTGKIELNLN